MNIDITSRLRSLRAELGLTQVETAKGVGIPLKTYSNIENGKTSPSLANLIALADFYSVTIDYLVGRSNARYKT